MGFFGRMRKKAERDCCSVVLLAAGSSSRMGEDKIMMRLGDGPVILHSLQLFQSMDMVREIIVVTREDLIPEIARICRDHDLFKVRNIVRGGDTRVHSARIGTLEADRDVPLIAIHDGARPFVTREVAEAAIRRAAQTGAAAPAVALKDTVKYARDGVVTRTLEREHLYAVQTPQVFEASLIRAALQKALDDQAPITDDCSAVERLGMQVSLVEGDETNIKLTTPNDMLWGQVILGGGML